MGDNEEQIVKRVLQKVVIRSDALDKDGEFPKITSGTLLQKAQKRTYYDLLEKAARGDAPIEEDPYGKKITFYLVQWENLDFPNTWEPETDIKGVLSEFNHAPKKSSKRTISEKLTSNSKKMVRFTLEIIEPDDLSRSVSSSSPATPSLSPPVLLPLQTQPAQKVDDVTDAFIKTLNASQTDIQTIDNFAVAETTNAEGDTVLEVSDLGNITFMSPKLLLKSISSDDFIQKIINNLRELYAKKVEKYQTIYNKTQDGDTRQMIQTVLETASGKITSFSGTTPGLIEDVRRNLLDAITDQKNGILSLLGDARRELRNFLANQIYILSRSATPFTENFLNIALTGAAGTGKSKLANVIAYVYGKMGVLLKDFPNNIVVGSAKDVIASVEGETVNKTNKFLITGLESVIFIDEAYGIMACKPDETLPRESGYGPEAITEIVNFIDVYRGLSVIVVAGYEKAMQNCFFGANQGLSRRFPFKYGLPLYSKDDLTVQFINTVNQRFGKRMFSDEMMAVLKHIIKDLKFPNQAGDVANMVSIFANIIESYPGYEWVVEPQDDHAKKVDLFMISQVRATYNKRATLPTATTPTV